jgi:hypothetical protein
VDHQHHAKPMHRLQEGAELGLVEATAVDRSAHLNTDHPQPGDGVLEFSHRSFHVLQGNRGHGAEPVGRRLGEGGHPLIGETVELGRAVEMMSSLRRVRSAAISTSTMSASGPTWSAPLRG